MKNKYFGDINDYRKYGLIRLLSDRGKFATGICWMLTEDDSRNDGGRIGYLDDRLRPKWKGFDPELYDALYQAVVINKIRHAKVAESASILPRACFHSEQLTNCPDARSQFFRNALAKFRGFNLVFFDPDNGMEVQSIPYGRKGSLKYLYWKEAKTTFDGAHSLLIYQHFPRLDRKVFIRDRAKQFKELCSCEVHTYQTSHVVFFLVPQSRDIKYFRDKLDKVKTIWGNHINPMVH